MEQKANTLFDYLDWRGDLSLVQSNFCEVDGLILSILSYLDFSGLSAQSAGGAQPLRQALEACAARIHQPKGFHLLEPEEYLRLGQQAAHCRRFSDFRVFAYQCEVEPQKQMQFSAVSFLLPDNSIYMAFRGTDNTLVGWKEDFNMSFCEVVPAQLRAAQYAGQIARDCAGFRLRLGGHSKGGNLALWAAANLPTDLQERIDAAYSFDGPGFSGDFFASAGYGRIAPRAGTYIPESSIVGMLLTHPEEYTVIGSYEKAFLQHVPMSWMVQGPHFLTRPARTRLGQYSDAVLRSWIGSMSQAEREAFTDTLFLLLGYDRASTLDELSQSGIAANLKAIRHSYSQLKEADRKLLSELFHRLLEEMHGQLAHPVRDLLPEPLRDALSKKEEP